MYAIIQTGGKQYKVSNGEIVFVEKLNAQEGDEVSFDVLMLSKDDSSVVVGAPVVDGVKVTGKVLGNVKGEKIVVYKYKAKKNSATKKGHRQPYTKIEITAIG
jgi:large subunit ribosomal protein L21